MGGRGGRGGEEPQKDTIYAPTTTRSHHHSISLNRSLFYAVVTIQIRNLSLLYPWWARDGRSTHRRTGRRIHRGTTDSRTCWGTHSGGSDTRTGRWLSSIRYRDNGASSGLWSIRDWCNGRPWSFGSPINGWNTCSSGMRSIRGWCDYRSWPLCPPINGWSPRWTAFDTACTLADLRSSLFLI